MPEVASLIWLDEADATNPKLVGAKAALLAQARSHGLPVLDGFVVPVEASATAIRAAEALLGSRRHSGVARTAVFDQGPDLLLHESLVRAARRLGENLVVRSSSRAEAEELWAGAFASYLDLRPEEVTVGVVGCWASIFAPKSLERAECAGITPAEIGMAVLVQPRLWTAYGGVATLQESGEVMVAGTTGHPGPIVAGWEEGTTAVVDRDGSVHAPKDSPLSHQLVSKVAHLARRTWDTIGCGHIEWAADRDGTLYLLQAQHRTLGPSQHADRQAIPSWQDRDPLLGDLAGMMTRFPGPVGERWVWRWAAGLEISAPTEIVDANKPIPVIVTELQERAAVLAAQRWGGMADRSSPEEVWSALRRGQPVTLLDLIRRAAPVDPLLARTQLRGLDELAAALVAARVIPHAGWMWYLDPDSLERSEPLREGAGQRPGLGPWDPFIYGVAVSQGEIRSGFAAASGWGAGRLRAVRTPDEAARFCPREVIFADRPIGNVAPLLWNAAGLITAGGSPGAHLFEVASGLGVPAVCGVNVMEMIGDPHRHPDNPLDLIAAVDGDGGRVALLPCPRPAP